MIICYVTDLGNKFGDVEFDVWHDLSDRLSTNAITGMSRNTMQLFKQRSCDMESLTK